jgi:hypothetical protein
MTTTATSWIITLEEDPETKELLLPIPPEILEMKMWKEGDTLEWEDNKDGSWTLSKAEK